MVFEAKHFWTGHLAPELLFMTTPQFKSYECMSSFDNQKKPNFLCVSLLNWKLLAGVQIAGGGQAVILNIQKKQDDKLNVNSLYYCAQGNGFILWQPVLFGLFFSCCRVVKCVCFSKHWLTNNFFMADRSARLNVCFIKHKFLIQLMFVFTY